MSNKDNLWRLQDDEGKPAAEKPENNIKIKVQMSDGKWREVGTLQSIRVRESDEGTIEDFRRMWNSMEPGFVTINPPPVAVNVYERNPFDEAATIRTETIRHEFPDIFSSIQREVHRYRRMYYHSPEYISLNKEAYRSFWHEYQIHAYTQGRTYREETFMGIQVMCNPLQELPVMALGLGVEEAIEGRLYREQS